MIDVIYRSYDEMANCIRRNLWKVPSDADVIVGIPRSGMIPALMLAELLNKRCADLDSFVDGREMLCGSRGGMMRRGKTGKVVVIDDCVNSGLSLKKVRELLALRTDRCEVIYGCVYVESEKAKQMVDFWFEDISRPGKVTHLKEWNILHLYRKRMNRSMWDIDGLLCKDPPDDRDTSAYEAYLPDAVPMVIPTNRIGAFVTYRLEKYRDITEAWLARYGIDYGSLEMFDAPDRETRNGSISSARYKARLYSAASWAELFVESDVRQAERIFRYSGKPVYCYENGKLYNT